MRAFEQERGVVLIAVLIMAVIVSIFCVVSLLVSGTESQGTASAIQRDKALFVASSGLEDEFQDFNDIMQKASLGAPFTAFDALAGKNGIPLTTLVCDGVSVGQYSVNVDSVTTVDAWTRDISVTSTGWVPSSTDPKAVYRKITSVVRVGTGRSHVFDYVYFINNWGWYYGATIIANGNVRANGQFDFGGYASTVNRLPRYDTLSSAGTFSGKVDDGGVYSGWNVVNTSKVQGTASSSQYNHAFSDPLPMPNLTDLTVYETQAKANNSNVKIDGVQVCNAVVGDTEAPNLYLEGKDKNHPIVLNGPIVVRGNLIIKGYVTGKGSFYVAGNVYVAGDVSYVNNPTATPTATDQPTLEKWVQTNSSADALGLFARKHIIVGDYTNTDWQSNVGKWVTDSRNNSDEDSGADGIPNTKSGRDGILGTADDDVLENNGKFDVSTYTQADQTSGRIPTGKKVGDVVPGSGEDIDGDGAYTPATKVSDFTIPSSASLISANWAGNFPTNVTKAKNYKELCDGDGLSVMELDAAFYTNHSFAMYSKKNDKDLVFTGCLVSRNEDIVYAAKHCVFNYDMRLLQDSSPFCLSMPRTWNPIRMVMWKSN